jgi:hypothetical protein
MEGYFWRLTDPRTGRVIVALCGAHRDAEGARWSNVALAAHPGAILHAADLTGGIADPERLGVHVPAAGGGARRAFTADATRVRLDLGPRARLDLRLHDVRGWPRRAFGGLGIGHLVPGLSQHWHPHVLGARASGTAWIDGETIDLDGFTVYAEKNWGSAGFPDTWWWGQAHDFADADVCVAFAGGEVGLGPLRTTASAIVVRVGDDVIRLGTPLLSPARTRFASGLWDLGARGPRYEVELTASAVPRDAHVLPVPLPALGASVPGAAQHFSGRLHLRVRRRGRRRVLFAGDAQLAGLEHGGRAALAHRAGLPGASEVAVAR